MELESALDNLNAVHLTELTCHVVIEICRLVVVVVGGVQCGGGGGGSSSTAIFSCFQNLTQM
jgi:hypothetical protein